jgi:hypothetical protein
MRLSNLPKRDANLLRAPTLYAPAAVLALLFAASVTLAENGRLAETRAATDAAYAEQLRALADKCDELGLAPQSEVTRGWFIGRAPDRQYLFLVPESDPARPPDDAPVIIGQWYRKFCEYRTKQADLLFRLAQQEIESGHPTTAFRLVHEVLREQPDHEQARRALGYTRVAGRWRLPGTFERTRVANVMHPKLGWAAGKYWRVETPHFEIVTSHSPRAGLELGHKLEELFTVWQQLFVRYWADDALIAARLAGRGGIRAARRHYKVVLFRDRAEYVAQLSRSQPQIGMSLGYYMEHERTAFFYWGDVETESTWFHEGTHQLFQETRLRAAGVGQADNFWVVEAVALYMESLAPHDGYYTAGGVEASRLQYARNRLLVGNFYVPLRELVTMGRGAFQTDERIRPLYSQCAGLGHFLMDAEGGRHRQALIQYLRSVYQGATGMDLLERLTQTPLERLDGEYRNFLDVTDDQLSVIPRETRPTKLALGHTSVSDEGILALPNVEKLEWLDLSRTRVGDRGIARLGNAKSLEDLNLEGTRVTDTAMAVVGGLTRLKELDLSETAISDAGLERLKSLVYLTTLWLTDTKITDGGLKHLTELSRLEYLNLNETQVTPAGYEALKQAVPSLEGS